jgi:anaerobic selenocysteine-containing dehydrogenase
LSSRIRRICRAILRDFLSASGYTVIEAVDGAESVAKAASQRTDLVLMDIQLPVLDGYDATRQIKALPGLAAIPIIAVSSFEMVICVDLFMNGTARRFADVVLPGTAWLEELGFKVTNTHLYLMERALEREGETRPIYEILRSLANSLGLADFFPWGSVEEVLNAILDHPTTGHATVALLRAGGFLPLKVSHVAYGDRNFDSPSGKIEFYSSQADKLGLSALPVHKVDQGSPYRLALSFGKTDALSFLYDEGQALPSLAKHNAAPQLWISKVDAGARQLSSGDVIKIYNERGEFGAKAMGDQLTVSGHPREDGS